MAEVLTTATYPEPEVRADRDRAADETVIALSQPEVVAQQALRRRIFAGHPYATPLPTPAALRRVKAAELKLLHPALLGPAGAHLVLVGDFQVPRALRPGGGGLGRMARAAPGPGHATWPRQAHRGPARSNS